MAKQYYLFNPTTRIYSFTNYYEIQPSNSVDFPPTIDCDLAMLNEDLTEWIDRRTNDEIIKELVPESVSKMKFFLSLLEINITRTIIYAEVDKIPDPILKETILIKLELSTELNRNDVHLNMLANTFNINQKQLDQLFIKSI